MKFLATMMKDFFADEQGATALEYGLLAALIAAVIVGAVVTIGTNLNAAFTFIGTKIPATYK